MALSIWTVGVGEQWFSVPSIGPYARCCGRCANTWASRRCKWVNNWKCRSLS